MNFIANICCNIPSRYNCNLSFKNIHTYNSCTKYISFLQIYSWTIIDWTIDKLCVVILKNRQKLIFELIAKKFKSIDLTNL